LTRRKPRGFASRVNIRRAIAADAPGIAAVHVASWQVAYRGLFPDAVLDGLSVADRQAQWTRGLVAGGPTIWIAEEGGRVTGFISLLPSRDADAPPPRFAEIAALYVHPDVWGQGCGRALVEAVLAHLRQTPTESVIVWALTGNLGARHFYERLGFARDDGRRDITLFNVTQPEVRFRHNLR
jgi:GNAT superfamily N-acetyltransferase